jgi:hypothetical protein
MSFFPQLVGATVPLLCQNPNFDPAKVNESNQQISKDNNSCKTMELMETSALLAKQAR